MPGDHVRAGRGDFIGGRFLPPEGEELISTNPARECVEVCRTAWAPARIDLAVDAAAVAQGQWASLPRDQRYEVLLRFRSALQGKSTAIAGAIVAEIGKLRSEAEVEVSGLLSRFALVRDAINSDLIEGAVPGFPGEQLRYHPLGVVGVIGPYNFPLHLCHAHVLPALLMGNTCVVKPSEVAPWTSELYAEAAFEAELPPGILNIVQGRGEAGRRLASRREVRGVCFTGSYPVGRSLQELAVDRPELLLALEMGGRNTAIVLEDADMRQAIHEIVIGGYLTTGQRCTATNQVLVRVERAGEFIAGVAELLPRLRFGDPLDDRSFAGPLASRAAQASYLGSIAAARAQGADVVVAGEQIAGGCFVTASVHVLSSEAKIPGYTDTEVFGPDLCVQVVRDDEAVVEALRSSPYGLANSVFTASDSRFERLYRDSQSGILNRNRSTNQASPRLPFGGVGRSGNYRPAGGHAQRNVVSSVAIQENVVGSIREHEHLAPYLPPPDLDRLECQHRAEEEAEAKRNLLDSPRPLAIRLPRDGVIPRSDQWLTRLYAGDRVVREKKPLVFDHLRSAGPYLVSIDDDEMSVLDGMSQTATLCAGFSESEVVSAYVEGEFADTLAQTCDPTVVGHASVDQYATVLRQLVPGLPEVTFTNSGAEATEKALALAKNRATDAQRRRVLAFEGSFHGRTWLSLSATWSPKKREPFELIGYEAVFVPFPVWDQPNSEEPAAPPGFFAAAGHGDMDALRQRYGETSQNELLSAEVASLVAADAAMRSGECFACIVEPMQSEGGDRYATQRFFRALRLLTRHHGMPLIFDEVQTGFGLGGAFAWHSAFNLVNVRGQQDYPDAVCFAKRAQVGVCMSVWPDPEPTSVQPASLVRGRLHAEMMSTSHGAERIQSLVAPRLSSLHVAFPHLVHRPRSRGYAFAFDLPTPEHLNAFLAQRFWRGAVVFAAGDTTARYRLNDSFLALEVGFLFDAIRRSLAWLDAHPHAIPPTWDNQIQPAATPKDSQRVQVRRVDPVEALGYLHHMLDIELRAYERARRTPPDEIREALEHPDSIVHVADMKTESGPRLVGFAIGQPLEAARELEGPDRDAMLDKKNTLYSMSLTVDPEWQGLGVGRLLKLAQLRSAREQRGADGKHRYRYVSGRNRVGLTQAMTRLNRSYGAHQVCVLTGQYDDPEGQAFYYRIPLPPWEPPSFVGAVETQTLNLCDGISRPLSRPSAQLESAQSSGLLYGPAVNKLTLMNYVTPAIVRALEWVQALVPELPHLYLTSSRDETIDKCLRILRTHRPRAQVAVGFVGGYVGHTSAAARSLSDPMVHRQGQGHYAWPLIPHPRDIGVEASLALVRETLAEHGAEQILGIFLEPVQERTGKVVDPGFGQGLRGICRDTGVPLIAVETATSYYRSGLGAFASKAMGLHADAMVWWGGAHTGYIHVSGSLRVGQPLAMVSTWDGDELSLVRENFQLRAARTLELKDAIACLDRVAKRLGDAGYVCQGAGLYRVIDGRGRGDEILAALAQRNVALRDVGGGRLAIVPALDTATETCSRLATVVEDMF